MINFPVPNFRLLIVAPEGFQGPSFVTQPMSINQATDAIADGTTVTFGCSFIGCSECGTAAKMKNLDHGRVYEGAVAPVCANHAEELNRAFGINTFSLIATIRRLVEANQAKQRLATMGRFLIASTPEVARPAATTNGTVPHLQMVGANGK